MHPGKAPHEVTLCTLAWAAWGLPVRPLGWQPREPAEPQCVERPAARATG